MIKKNCLICSKEFYTYPSNIRRGQGKYCSNECKIKAGHKKGIYKHTYFGSKNKNIPNLGKFGKKHPNWRGGCREYWSHVARRVLEKHGIEVPDGTIIHHINGNFKDNRIENLQIFPNHSGHTKLHYINRVRDEKGRFMSFNIGDCSGSRVFQR